MAYQNINQYVYPKWYLLNRSEIMDFSLASDERDYNQEVVFSPLIIGINDGNKLPISFDLNSSGTSEQYVLTYGNYNPYNILISENYYNPNNEDLTCFSSQTICDIGLTGTDNGLVEDMTGETITTTKGLLPDIDKFDRLSFDRRLKMHQITGYTDSPNIQFSGLDKTMLFNIVSKQEEGVGIYHELYGGFYQGFYKLFGYDYETFPTRTNKGWSVEMLLKPRLADEYIIGTGETTLNEFYPNNKNMFFYFGTRSENKYYHHASGSPESYTGYTRITESLTDLLTCACCDTTVSNSRCISVYPQFSSATESSECDESSGVTCWGLIEHSCPNVTTTTTTCSDPCYEPTDYSVEYLCETDPLFDGVSNAIGFKLCGDPKNPQIGIRILRFTGDCVTTGTCVTGLTYTTGYTIDELCTTKGVYDYCETINPDYLDVEHWFMVDVVWERYEYLEECDLYYKGGLGLITDNEYLLSLAEQTVQLIAPPYTNGCEEAETIDIVSLNDRWLEEKDYRMGRLKVYLNGRIVQTFENIEEIIPRALQTDKEKQVGVPFNISWGGGSQGLHNHLIFTGIPQTLTGLTYTQDPELFPDNVLSGTSLSALTTNILIEQNFGGSFDGGISQFRMYAEPLSADEVKHNFLILKNRFDMFNPDCPDCSIIVVTTTTTIA